MDLYEVDTKETTVIFTQRGRTLFGYCKMWKTILLSEGLTLPSITIQTKPYYLE